jgi:hypothetical protein
LWRRGSRESLYAMNIIPCSAQLTARRPAVSRPRLHRALGGAAHLRPYPLHLPRCSLRNSRRRWTGARQSTTTRSKSYGTAHWPPASIQSRPSPRRPRAKHQRRRCGYPGCTLSLYHRREGRRLVYHLMACTVSLPVHHSAASAFVCVCLCVCWECLPLLLNLFV